MILHWHDYEKECEYAVKTDTEAFLYDENFDEIMHITNITDSEWNYISLQNGEWSEPYDIPSVKERLESDIDYLEMMNESMEADIDYCLMMLGE